MLNEFAFRYEVTGIVIQLLLLIEIAWLTDIDSCKLKGIRIRRTISIKNQIGKGFRSSSLFEDSFQRMLAKDRERTRRPGARVALGDAARRQAAGSSGKIFKIVLARRFGVAALGIAVQILPS
ncbi:hypothetical protein DDZ13_08455 [Coraliomargarita sinensis]|uniref:Uncharacterized protein n=1 Tax=Coraliomargarita sinensis TaxID=2174842 RepID=A0A317ZL18_9BACT|nr:hypothetical protein DDZ13_08455 [Coraliomargarita sinensis]